LATLQLGLQALRTAQQLDPLAGAALAVAPHSSALKPHPVYELGLDDLAAGKGIEAARPIAWRYLLVTGDQVCQAAELFPDPQGGSRFGALTTGYAAAEEEALRLAEQLPEIQQGTYEIRALRVPALYVMALWLKDQNGTRDHFIVMPPAFPPVQPLHPYSTADLLALLQPLAARKAPLEKQVTPP